jgi:CRISPR-associated endonuclease/helicase Cas3
VIVGTQDQVLSRQLNRGYACSRWSWPQHFALLNNDCEFFIDECQLMGPGFSTSVELAHWRNALGVYGNCRVVWSSATLDTSPLTSRNIQSTEINLMDADYSNSFLSKKISRLKSLQKIKIGLDDYAQHLAEHILTKHISGTMTLAIVNQVSRAIAVYKALKDSGVEILLLHSRFRPGDREGLVLRTFQGIIVSTQVVESGVDLDARSLFTEVTSWASMVQRFGRCGRNSTYDTADIYWIDCEGWSNTRLSPYSKNECEWSRKTLESLDNASIQNLLKIQMPSQILTGKTITKDHLKDLFDNHPDPDRKDISISDFIRSNSSLTIPVAWVDSPPAPDWSPSHHELCPVPTDKLAMLTKRVYVWNEFTETWNLETPKAGKPAVLLKTWGGYSNLLGFTGNPSDVPPLLPSRDQESQKAGWDRPAYLPATQAQHGAGQAFEMARIRGLLDNLDLPDFLDEIAAWSDLGKSHPVWQKSATDEEQPSVLMAKTSKLRRHSRKGFRHELGSALALMTLKKPFIYVYLAAAHHGKCRSLFAPWIWEKEALCKGNERLVKGIKSGDKLPATDLGVFQSTEVSLDLPEQIEWEQEVRNLLKEFGPFKLAFLEALVRAADIADSKKYERG